MKYTTSLLAVLLSGNIFAQIQQEPATVLPLEKIRKNEIGLNLTGPIHHNQYDLIYKRALQKNQYLRIGITASNSVNSQPGYYKAGNYINGIGYAVDSVTYCVNDVQREENKIALAIGMEDRINIKNFQVFYGADLIGGKNYFNTYTYQDKVSINNTNGGQAELQDKNLVEVQNQNITIFGLKPFAGIMVPLGKRFLVSTQITMSTTVGFGETTSTDKVANTSTNYGKFTTFDFNQYGFMNNVSLHYRF